MDNLLDELVRVAKRCEAAAKTFHEDPVDAMQKGLLRACQEVGEAWCGSYLGYHASVYMEGLRPKRPGEHFDPEWGAMESLLNRTSGRWCEFSFETVRNEITHRAGVDDMGPLNEAVRAAGDAFDDVRQETLPILDAILSRKEDAALRGIRVEIAELKDHFTQDQFARRWLPRGQQMTRDMLALSGGVRLPPHLQFQSWLLERYSWGEQASTLAKLTRQAVNYLRHKMQMEGNTVAKTDGSVFIGHGGSAAWRDLKDFLKDRLGLSWDEFNRESVAGKSTKERLQAMLDKACFAFLVMTGEDERADGTKHARENVIHEVGLFQGRLGFERAIILLEDGCAEFSNIVGLTQIRFPKGNIMANSEDIRRVLEREGLLK